MELALVVARKYWSQIALGLLALGLNISLGITRNTLSVRTQTLTNTQNAFTNFKKDVELNTEKAKADDLAHAKAVQEADDKIKTESENELQNKLAAANRRATEYATKLRNSANPSPRSVGPAGVPETSPAPAGIDGASQSSLLDEVEADAQVCAENTVKAQGWQDWWKQVEAVPDR